MKTIKPTLLVFLFTVVSCLLIFKSPLLAQDAKDNNTRPEEVPLQIEDNRVNVPLQSVLMLALKNNLDIIFASLQPEIAATDVTREKSAYDTLFTSQFSKNRYNQQKDASFGQKDTVSEEMVNLDVSVRKKFTPGTQAELSLNHYERQTDSEFYGLVPMYSGDINLSLTQPLLKDFGIEIGKSMIKIAKLNLEVSENEFRKNVMDILFQIESYYWNLFFQIEDLKSKEGSLKRAESFLREFKIRIDAGTLAPIEIYQAKAEVALRKQEVIVAKARVKQAEDNLKSALNLYEDQTYWNINIIPIDQPETEKTQPDLLESIQIALEKRPDFKQAQLNIKASDIQVKYSKNQTLPRIDLIGSIGSNGIAGRPVENNTAFLGPILGRLFKTTNPSPYRGHWDDVYDHMADKDIYNYYIGIKFEFPLENRMAKSQYSRSKIQASQSVTSLKNAENLIINEVRDAIRILETSREVIGSAEASLKYSQERLKAEEKKYKVGMSTAYLVLEFQDELSQAESTLAYAQTEHSKSIANLSRVMGVLLEDKGLEM